VSRGTRVPASLWSGQFAYRTLTVCGRASHPVRLPACPAADDRQVVPRWAHNPPTATAAALHGAGLGSSPVRSPLLGASRLLPLPRGTEMFHFPRFPSPAYGFSWRYPGITRGGLPHSEIRGSQPVDGSPRLFAVSHVLHRPLAPRHPPRALLRSALPHRSPEPPSSFFRTTTLHFLKVESCRPRVESPCGPSAPNPESSPAWDKKIGLTSPQAVPRACLVEIAASGCSRSTGVLECESSTPPRPGRPAASAKIKYTRSCAFLQPSPTRAGGGDGRIRTPDLPRARRALSH
jgi:hypothetical protein